MKNLRTAPLRDDADLSTCARPRTMPSSSSEMLEKAQLDAAVIQRADLAAMYGVDVRVLNQAVARNADRFPSDFMLK
jgi:ORF6N domain